jgi:hypothetical protein
MLDEQVPAHTRRDHDAQHHRYQRRVRALTGRVSVLKRLQHGDNAVVAIERL